MNAHPAEPPWYGPVCPVVWEGRHREVPPYPDYPHDARLLVGCQVGGRSTQAVQVLVSHGYQHAANVRGGFGGARDPATGELVDEGWSLAGLPVETTAPPGGSYEELRKNLT